MNKEKYKKLLDEIYESLTIQALQMRREIFFGGGISVDTFDQIYLNGLGEYERQIAEREGIEL